MSNQKKEYGIYSNILIISLLIIVYYYLKHLKRGIIIKPIEEPFLDNSNNYNSNLYKLFIDNQNNNINLSGKNINLENGCNTSFEGYISKDLVIKKIYILYCKHYIQNNKFDYTNIENKNSIEENCYNKKKIILYNNMESNEQWNNKYIIGNNISLKDKLFNTRQPKNMNNDIIKLYNLNYEIILDATYKNADIRLPNFPKDKILINKFNNCETLSIPIDANNALGRGIDGNGKNSSDIDEVIKIEQKKYNNNKLPICYLNIAIQQFI